MHCVTTISLRPGPASIARRALQALASTLSGAYTGWIRHRQICATARVLGLLDDRLLHDLALDRSELLSAAAELHGRAGPERRRTGLAAPAAH